MSPRSIFLVAFVLVAFGVAIDLALGPREKSTRIPFESRAIDDAPRASNESALTSGDERPSADARTPGAVERTADAAPTRGGRTLLHVRVVDAAGAAVLEGRIEVLSSAQRNVEAQLRPARRELPIAGEVTDVELAASQHEAIVCAASRAGDVGRTACARLRDVEGHWRVDGTLERDVVVQLAPETSAAIAGAIHVDGRARVPAGLIVAALVEELAPQPADERRRVLALVDPFRARYRVEATRRPWAGLWVTSDETVPCWIPVPGGDPPARIDLELSSGRTLALEVVERGNGRPASGCALQVEVLVPVGRDSAHTEYRTHAFELRAGADGRCAWSGLPERGHVALAQPASRPGGAARRLLTLELTPELPEHIERRIEVDGAGDAELELWGECPDAEVFAPGVSGALSVFVRANAGADTAPRAVPCGASDAAEPRWSSRVSAGVEHEAWLARGGQRVSEIVRAPANASGSFGPIVFVPRDAQSVRVRWSNAPSEASLRIVLEDGAGASERAGEWALDGASGERVVFVDGPRSIEVALVTSSRDAVTRTFAWRPGDAPFLDVDLAGDGAVELALVLDDSARLAEPAHLALVALDDPALVALDETSARCTTTATIALAAGGTSQPVPLPAGRWFYRADGRALRASVCGVVDRARVTRGRFEIRWVGAGAGSVFDGAPTGKALALLRCGAHDIAGRVPAPWRRFELPDSGGLGRDERGMEWLFPVDCSFASLR